MPDSRVSYRNKYDGLLTLPLDTAAMPPSTRRVSDMADDKIVTKKTAAKPAATKKPTPTKSVAKKTTARAPAAKAPAAPRAAAPAAPSKPEPKTAAPAQTAAPAPKPAAAARPAPTPAARVVPRAPSPRPGSADRPTSLQHLAGVGSEERLEMIRVAAYYRSEKRGNAPGSAEQDWADAEREIDALLARAKSSVGS